ncbi:MAG: DUF6455 family protein [Hyphomicrobiaceae bacterium]
MGQSKPNRPMTEKVWHVAALLEGMTEKLGLTGAAVRLEQGEALLAAQQRCYACPAQDRCAHWLTSEPSRPAVPQFCPNASFLAACRDRVSAHVRSAPAHPPAR